MASSARLLVLLAAVTVTPSCTHWTPVLPFSLDGPGDYRRLCDSVPGALRACGLTPEYESVGEAEAEFVGRHPLGRVRILVSRTPNPSGGEDWIERVVQTDTRELRVLAVEVSNRIRH